MIEIRLILYDFDIFQASEDTKLVLQKYFNDVFVNKQYKITLGFNNQNTIIENGEIYEFKNLNTLVGFLKYFNINHSIRYIL